MSATRLLVLEDDDSIREALVEGLTLDGYDVDSAADLSTARSLFGEHDYSLLLLDVVLPDGSGLELLRDARHAGFVVPIVILTARGTEEDRVFGFEHGCDDYVVKPFSLQELRLRLKALLRRSQKSVKEELQPSSASRDRRISLGNALVDLDAYRVEKNGSVIHLSPKERDMIVLFAREAGRVVSRTEFLNEVWGYDRFPTTRTVDMHVRKLRHKIEDDAESPIHFITVHGAGYRLDL